MIARITDTRAKREVMTPWFSYADMEAWREFTKAKPTNKLIRPATSTRATAPREKELVSESLKFEVSQLQAFPVCLLAWMPLTKKCTMQ